MSFINKDIDVKSSKLLSLVLRHTPEKIGLAIDYNGWADIKILIDKINYYYPEYYFDYEKINSIVKNCNKKRFAISDDGTKIRANQGHSINVDLELNEQIPPKILYHGTSIKFLDEILDGGLISKNRQFVHLSSDSDIAKEVGMRHGKPIVLIVQSFMMNQDNYKFFLTKNNVWITKIVPKQYICY